MSIGSVRGWLITNRGISIASSTLMNLRTDPRTGEKKVSPARSVINKYADFQKFTSKRTKKRPEPNLASLVFNDSEMREIADHQVRYKVQLLVGRVRNLEAQLNHVRTISNLPQLTTANAPHNPSTTQEDRVAPNGNGVYLSLDDAEREALHDFLNERSMHRRKLRFDENGVLKATHPANSKTLITPISKPFLEGALRKVLHTYQKDFFL